MRHTANAPACSRAPAAQFVKLSVAGRPGPCFASNWASPPLHTASSFLSVSLSVRLPPVISPASCRPASCRSASWLSSGTVEWMTDEREETRDAGAGVCGGGGWGVVEKRLLVDSAPVLSSGVHKQTLINRRRSASPPPPPRMLFFLSLAPSGNNLELGAPKRDLFRKRHGTHARRARGREQRGIKAQCENSLFFFF